MIGKCFAVEMSRQYPTGAEPDRIKLSGEDVTDPAMFAGVLTGVILAHRAAQGVWGNGEDFGGHDLVEMAARFVVLLVSSQMEPGGFWHFDSDAEAEREEYALGLAAVRALLTAAHAIIDQPD